MIFLVYLVGLFKKQKDSRSSQATIELEDKKDNECTHHFGYLAKRPKNSSFPEECILCEKVVECLIQ